MEGLKKHTELVKDKRLIFCKQSNKLFVFVCYQKAYKRWSEDNREDVTLPGLDYSPEQLFFIGAAQVWCSKATNEALLTQMLTNPHSVPQYR